MNFSIERWIRISFFNLCLVAAMGVILRYKIAFSLPFVDQKYLLHAHSHFAFAGWISQIIMVLMVYRLSLHSQQDEFRRYRYYLSANLLTAYGMLISFPLQGYGLYSIVFSTLSIFASYAFAIRSWTDLSRAPIFRLSKWWYKAALVFNCVSSLGAFYLAYMMATKNIHQEKYLGSVYFFLHFQYNGWFFFACMGLLYEQLEKYIPAQKLGSVFFLMLIACVPAYFLSALWLPIPVWVYVCVVIAAIIQVLAWAWLGGQIFKMRKQLFPAVSGTGKYLMALSAIALTIKLLLQAGSTIPALSQLAFGFRPIVVGYLHLVLLGVISLFLLGYIFSLPFFHPHKLMIAGGFIFSSGVILNEISLMIQGIAAMDYTPVRFINEILFVMALILFCGALCIRYGLSVKQRN